MKELYVTNTETVVSQTGQPEIHLFGRTETGKSDRVIVEGYDPHFYVHEDEKEKLGPMDHDYLEGYTDTELRGIKNDDPLVKVVVSHPFKIGKVAQHFDRKFRSDVDYTDLFRIDYNVKTGIRAPSGRVSPDEIEPVEMESPPRVVTFDIETDDRGEGFPSHGEARILSVVAHDSYTEEYVAFIDMEGHGLGERFPDADLNEVDHPSDLGLEHVDQLKFEPDEKGMLKAFYSWLEDTDPDLLAGWNSNGFDTPFLIERGTKIGVSSDRMARSGDAYLNWRDDPVVQGRSCFDLMDGWKDTKFTKVSGSLDEAASMELDDAKIPHPDKGFYELYSENTRKFLNYNAKDTYLTVQVNEAANVIAFKTALRDAIGLDYEDTSHNKDYISMMVRRKLREKGYVGPAADPPEEDEDYDGAYVFPAFNGVKSNIVGIDLASLYPNTLWMLNASPETKVDPLKVEERDDGLYALIEVADDGQAEWVPVARSSNDVYFRLDEDGIFRELVDEALSLKEHAGEMKTDDSLSAEERAEWAEEYSVRKTIVNSIYGVLGWERFFLYDKDIAAAVTLTGQEVIKETARFVDDETAANVAYGDTDSNYIEFPDDWSQERCLEEADAICNDLNHDAYQDLAAELGMNTDVSGIDLPTRFEIELEMYASRFFMSGSKKFYAYLKTWDEGMEFDAQLKDGKGKLSISGYPCKKANTAALTCQVQRDVLEGIVRGEDDSELRSIIRDGAKNLDPANPDWDAIGIPSGLGQPLNEYTWTDGSPQGAAPRAAYYGNKFIDECNFGDGDTVKRCYLKSTWLGDEQVDVIGYERGAQMEALEDDVTIDVPRMQDTLIRNPMVDILDAVDIDVDAAIEGQSQQGLSAFC